MTIRHSETAPRKKKEIATYKRELGKKKVVANAAPTFVFLDSHMPHSGRDNEMRKRIPSGVVASRFRCDDVSQLAEERRALAAARKTHVGTGRTTMAWGCRLAKQLTPDHLKLQTAAIVPEVVAGQE